MRMTKLSALAAVTAVAALLASTTPALAENKSPISAEAVALMTTQQKLHKIADRVKQRNGFAGFYVDAGSKTLNVYWKGTVPAKVKAEAIAAKAQGLNVKVHQAKYSKAELNAEAARLVKSNRSITGIGAKHDGSGLTVKQNAGLSLQSAVQSSVPVDVETSDVQLTASRYDGTSPFKAGAYIENVNLHTGPGGACSSGFAVVHNSTGADKLLTAAHCGEASSSYFMTGPNNMIGWVESRSVNYDTETIGATGQPRVWIGDSIQTEQNQYSLDVIGASRTLPGEWLCTSGAYSGTICEIRAVAVDLDVYVNDWGWVYDTVEAVHNGGYSAGGNGDSGGPIFSVQQPGDRLVARGTLTAINGGSDIRQCSGVPEGGGRVCSQRIFFPDIVSQMEQHNVRIKTVS